MVLFLNIYDLNILYFVQIEMHKCFRPGDIVLAKVQSLGDTQSYILNTAENELGVIIAKSEAGTCFGYVYCDKHFLFNFLRIIFLSVGPRMSLY